MKKMFLSVALFAMAYSQQPYVGEIRTFGYNFCPNGWYELNGQLISIVENETLFQLIGTTYGGDGQETFGIPDMRGRIAVGSGSGKVEGEMAGQEQVTLTQMQIPAHSHNQLNLEYTVQLPVADSNKTQANANHYFGPSESDAYVDSSVTSTTGLKGVTLDAKIVGQMQTVGYSQPIDIRPPQLGLIHCMSAFGIFPSQY